MMSWGVALLIVDAFLFICLGITWIIEKLSCCRVGRNTEEYLVSAASLEAYYLPAIDSEIKLPIDVNKYAEIN